LQCAEQFRDFLRVAGGGIVVLALIGAFGLMLPRVWSADQD
jgi:hypothetical protein